MEHTQRPEWSDIAEWTCIRFELSVCVRVQDMESSLWVLKLLVCFGAGLKAGNENRNHECFPPRLSNSLRQAWQTALVIDFPTFWCSAEEWWTEWCCWGVIPCAQTSIQFQRYTTYINWHVNVRVNTQNMDIIHVRLCRLCCHYLPSDNILPWPTKDSHDAGVTETWSKCILWKDHC